MRTRPVLLIAAAVASAASAQNLPPAADLANLLWSVPLEELRAVRERPLFSPTRRPAPAIRNTEAVSPSPSPVLAPPFALVGTVSTGDDKIVVLFDKAANASVTLRIGASASGWTLAKVAPRAVVLRQGDVSATLTLPAPSDPVPVVPGRPSQGEPE